MKIHCFFSNPAALFVIFTAVCHVISNSPQTHSSTSIIHFARQLLYGMQIKDLRKVLIWDLVGRSHTAVRLDNNRPEFHRSLLLKGQNKGESDSEGPVSLILHRRSSQRRRTRRNAAHLLRARGGIKPLRGGSELSLLGKGGV